MIEKQTVQKVATLARIYLKDNEIDSLSKDMSSILDYVEQLNELDVSDVQPTSHALKMENVHREDVIRPSLDRDKLLSHAVESEAGSFKVPKVIDA